ncbi:Uu.00g147180.m01.CDS01 [Anthostomella pinea]|uniref:Uu.00g147180.m01.CDS01 n=1 Tax=Anthostomella pinea TaxID=933095 RepID=A0AAI8YM01_9PEZI|nr:Uu.00g147180.m01.CDS01 [Anthostomella pinea]
MFSSSFQLHTRRNTTRRKILNYSVHFTPSPTSDTTATMQHLLQNLPPELLAAIVEELPWESRLSLSATSSVFRAALAARFFRAIVVSNKPGTSLDGLRAWAEKYGSLVDEVHFLGSRDGLDNTVRETSQEEDGVHRGTQCLLPTLLQGILSGTRLSQASTVRVSFDFDFNRGHEPGSDWESESELLDDDIDSIYVFQVPEETLQVIKHKEDRYPWRQLMAETCATLAQNQNVRKLVMEELVPKPTSTFFTTAWSSFLGQLDVLDISGIWSEDNGAGWHANTLDGYLHFEAHMGDYFFEHARSLRHVRLSAASATAFGVDGNLFDCALPLEKCHLPHQQRLELQYMLISPKLADFVLVKGTTLRSLRLVDCHANTDADLDQNRTFPC